MSVSDANMNAIRDGIINIVIIILIQSTDFTMTLFTFSLMSNDVVVSFFLISF